MNITAAPAMRIVASSFLPIIFCLGTKIISETAIILTNIISSKVAHAPPLLRRMAHFFKIRKNFVIQQSRPFAEES